MSDELTCKIVLVGESGVGKSSIIDKYINSNFDINSELSKAATFLKKNLEIKDGKTLELEIWDIPGDENMKESTKYYLPETAVFIFVYDVTNKESFERLKNSWVNYIREYIEKQRENFSDKSK